MSGGVQKTTHTLSRYFNEKNHDVHIFSYQTGGHIAFEHLNLYHVRNKNTHKDPVNNKKLYDLICKLQPHIVINQKAYAQEISFVLKKAKIDHNFLSIYCLHNSLFTVKYNIKTYIEKSLPGILQILFNNKLGQKLVYQGHKWKHSKDLKFILDHCDNFVLFGPPNYKELKSFVGAYKKNKIRYIPNSISEIRKDLPKKEKRILWLGRLSYKQKRADLIIPLWKLLKDILPDWHLDVVGDGDAYRDLEKQIKEEKIPRINLYGKREPKDFYVRSQIYIMTSENEGFPNTLLEAQAQACIPVVFESYPICSWLLENNKNAILIPPFDLNNFTSEIIEIANNEEKKKSLSLESLANAKKFHVERVGNKWLELFKNSLNEIVL